MNWWIFLKQGWIRQASVEKPYHRKCSCVTKNYTINKDLCQKNDDLSFCHVRSSEPELSVIMAFYENKSTVMFTEFLQFRNLIYKLAFFHWVFIISKKNLKKINLLMSSKCFFVILFSCSILIWKEDFPETEA